MIMQVLRFLPGLSVAGDAMISQAGMNPMAGMQQNPLAAQDPDKLFKAEAENLELVQHEWILDGIEERLVNTQF
jgi:ER membrane protein complex subunit 3